MPRDYFLQIARYPTCAYKVLLHLWGTANWKDGVWVHRWGTETIKRGERICSEVGLAYELGESRQKIRTALKTLERLGEIQPTHNPHFTRINVLNYDAICTSTSYYTSESQPTPNPDLTTIEEGKKVRSKEKNTSLAAKAATEYVLPDPKTNPKGCLVLSYKSRQGVPYDNRDWDQANFGRAMVAAGSLLGLCGSLSLAEECLNDLSTEYETKGLSWTLETISRNASQWLKKRGLTNENSSKSGLRMAIARQRSKTENQGGLVKVSEGSVLDAFRDGKDSPGGDQADGSGERRGLNDENVA